MAWTEAEIDDIDEAKRIYRRMFAKPAQPIKATGRLSAMLAHWRREVANPSRYSDQLQDAVDRIGPVETQACFIVRPDMSARTYTTERTDDGY